MFSDPQSLTYNSVAKSLPAITRGDDGSEYRLDDGSVRYTLAISHQFKARSRVNARLTRDTTVTDPLDSSRNIATSVTVSFTVDSPIAGILPADQVYAAKMLVAWLSDANLAKLVGGET